MNRKLPHLWSAAAILAASCSPPAYMGQEKPANLDDANSAYQSAYLDGTGLVCYRPAMYGQVIEVARYPNGDSVKAHSQKIMNDIAAGKYPAGCAEVPAPG